MDYLTNEESKKPITDEEEILGEHQQSRIRIQDGINGNLSDLITNSSCMDCNGKLEWEASFNLSNERIPIPTGFTAKHCRRLYSISGFITSVRVSMVTDEEARDQVDKQKSKKHEAKVKKEAEEKQQKDKELAESKKLQEDRDLADKKAADKTQEYKKLAEETQNKKDLAEIKKQGFNVDKEGGQADALDAQKDAQTVATHAEDPNTRKQANTIANRLDKQTTDEVNK
jgi:hypothetical protein